jgi:hypothetical protein
MVLLYALLASRSICGAADTTGMLNGGSGVCSNGAFSSTGAVGLCCPVGQSASSSLWVHAGMLASFLLDPNLDHDGDAVPDEDDWDDDDDGLRDADELTGSAFSPSAPSNPFERDSDGDGAADGQEAAAGTNPSNAMSAFRITDVRQEGTAFVITWQGREGVSYDLAVADSPSFAGLNIATNIVATGGTGTWFVAEVSVTNVPVSARLFYRVGIHE